MSIWKPISLFSMVLLLVLAVTGCSPVLPATSLVANQPAVQAAASSPLTQVSQNTASPTGGITVVGIGQVSAAPDLAQINVGVTTDGTEIKQAVTDNNNKMSALLDSLKAAGIAEKDIQTMNFSVSVDQQPVPTKGTVDNVSPESPAPVYHVNNQVQVTVRDLSKLSDILDKSVTSGANTIFGVSFSFSDPSKLQDDARAKAVADAKSRAEKLAQLEGLTLGNVLSVQEVSGMPGPIFDAARSSYGMGGGAPIQTGDMQVTVNLQVSYSIK